VASQVRIVGFQKNPFPFLSQADAFVMSSRYEGFPNVVLEALACGTPVIATPSIGGVREILEGVVGCVLAECVTAAGLAKVIDDWGNGEHTTIEADSVSRFLIQKIVCQYESVFLNNYA
jgi:glycosyltransferase involved in cell wall biosynthesis